MPKIMAATVAEHREQTYEALLDATDALIVEHGFDAVTMRDIAERAGVTRSAIYNYASDKMALLSASVQRTASTLHAAMTEAALTPGTPAVRRLEAVIRLLLTFAQSAQNLLSVRAAHLTLSAEQQRETIGAYQDDIGRHVRTLIDEGINAGDYASTTDLDLVVDLLTGVVDVAVGRVIDQPDRAEEIADTVVVFLNRALGKTSE